jgi:hypothetical protein
LLFIFICKHRNIWLILYTSRGRSWLCSKTVCGSVCSRICDRLWMYHVKPESSTELQYYLYFQSFHRSRCRNFLIHRVNILAPCSYSVMFPQPVPCHDSTLFIFETLARTVAPCILSFNWRILMKKYFEHNFTRGHHTFVLFNFVRSVASIYLHGELWDGIVIGLEFGGLMEL